jgi:hypothetical protein
MQHTDRRILLSQQPPRKLEPLYCSFCGKNQHQVKKLIAGPTVFICNECVQVCVDIIQREAAETEEVKGFGGWEPRP